MKDIVFVDIDTQFDFIMPTGKLYVHGSEDIIPNLKILTKLASKNSILIISSVDKHIMNEPEFKQFPPHCIKKSRGQKKIRQTLLKSHTFISPTTLKKREVFRKIKRYKQLILEKNTYDIFTPLHQPLGRGVTGFTNSNLLQLLKPFKTAFVYGVALDYCVKYAVLGLLKLGVSVNLIIDATKPVDAKEGEILLKEFKEKGVGLIKTKEAAELIS